MICGHGNAKGRYTLEVIRHVFGGGVEVVAAITNNVDTATHSENYMEFPHFFCGLNRVPL